MLTEAECEEAFGAGADGGLLVDVTGRHWAEHAFANNLTPNPPANLLEDR